MDPQEILTEILHMKEVKAAKAENYSLEPKTQTPTISTPELLCLLFGFSHSFIAFCTPVPQLPTLFPVYLFLQRPFTDQCLP